MKATLHKIAAVIEVALVTFVLVPCLTVGIYHLFPGFETWQTASLGFPVPPLIYVMEMGLPLIIILLHKRKPADYGIRFGQLRYQLDTALSCLFPVALAEIPIAMGVDYTTWSGASLLAVTQIGLLLVLAAILRKKKAAPVVGTAAVLLLLGPYVSGNSQTAIVRAIVIFLFYAGFVGFGEEILFRGYMQSRLNEVFGKPYHFFGVPFGWGAIITAVLFGLMHVGVLRWILGMSNEVTLAWGFWTMFGGLVFSLVREKSGGVLAPALLHGLPQAIAFAAMVFFPLSTMG
jgi:membrane protease YdiL (CAAX protease family)